MKFRKQRAIYLQIGDYLCENILTGTYMPGDKIPSVRDMAISVEVNPNTVMRTYTDLQHKEILFNQRGIGFFVAEDAVEKIMIIKKREFLATDLPNFFKTIEL
jgi:GntR family transcriptional regulator